MVVVFLGSPGAIDWSTSPGDGMKGSLGRFMKREDAPGIYEGSVIPITGGAPPSGCPGIDAMTGATISVCYGVLNGAIGGVGGSFYPCRKLQLSPLLQLPFSQKAHCFLPPTGG